MKNILALFIKPNEHFKHLTIMDLKKNHVGDKNVMLKFIILIMHIFVLTLEFQKVACYREHW